MDANIKDIYELVERPGEDGGAPVEFGKGDKAYRVFLHEFGMKHDLGDKS